MQLSRAQSQHETEEAEANRNTDQKKKARRTKKDGEVREFNCPCGKSYLSYPALYTHVKSKHNGKISESNPKQEKKNEPPVPTELSKNLPPTCHKTLSIISEELNKQFPNEVPQGFVEQAPADLQKLIKLIHQSDKAAGTEKEGRKKKYTINQIFSKLLASLRDSVTPKAYSYLEKWVYNFVVLISGNKGEENYCDQASGSSLPHHFNEYITTERVPSIEGSNKTSVSVVFGCKILFYFGKWLQEEGLTNCSIKLNMMEAGPTPLL